MKDKEAYRIGAISYVVAKDAERKKKALTCTQCHDVKDYHSQLVYSQGDLVCLDCKEENKDSDKRAYDRWAVNRW